jgi:hypothetical protein
MKMEKMVSGGANEKFVPKYSGEFYRGVEGSMEMGNHPAFIQILEDKCLAYLKSNNQEDSFFNREYSGELSPDGYLLDKEGKETDLLPSQVVGIEFFEIQKETAVEFITQYPEWNKLEGIREIKPQKYMMATEAFHKLGNMSSDTPELCVVNGETDEYYIGMFVYGMGYFDIRFSKKTTRDLTEAEIKEYDGTTVSLGGRPYYKLKIKN